MAREIMAQAQAKTFRLVIVENDDNDVFFIERALQRAGLECPFTWLADGQDAIDYFSGLEDSALPDLILLDVQVPRRDGFEVLRWLRQHPVYRRRRVMMLTSSDDPGDIRRAQTLGADQFLTKKIDCREVVEILEQLIRTPGT
jgi:CheY-like chemotaxis protein